MSGYTMGEIATWLLMAAGLGFALGWLVRELVLRMRPVAPAVQIVQADPIVVSIPEPVQPQSESAPVVPGPHPGSALPLPDGAAPSSAHVVKVSRSSKIYHAPSSPAYARTTAALWFTSTEDAEAAGFRRPKNG